MKSRTRFEESNTVNHGIIVYGVLSLRPHRSGVGVWEISWYVHGTLEAKKAISMFRHIFCQRRARLFVDGSMSPASVQTLLCCQPQPLIFI